MNNDAIACATFIILGVILLSISITYKLFLIFELPICLCGICAFAFLYMFLTTKLLINPKN
jgi:hypothetical protein